MEFFTMQTLWALFSIIMIDLVLSGDNAIVIALASRNLPKHQQNKAIVWGTVGAIIVRVLLTIAVLWLLKIPFLQLIGGILLIWIAFKLLTEEDSHKEDQIRAGKTLFAAIQTIVVADLIMGLDNILAIAGAARGETLLVIIGLAISVPIMIWGSKFILKWMERFPIIIQIGVAILGWTAGEMILNDRTIQNWMGRSIEIIEWILPAVLVVVILGLGQLKKRKLHSA